MADSKVDLILHPVRMRILMAMAGQQMTAAQLTKALPDVAQATLYRHISRLVDGGALLVVAERPVRGATEKVYELVGEQAMLSAADVAGLDKDDHLRLFTTFVISLLSDFSHYLENADPIDLAADGVGFHTIPLYVSDEELVILSDGLQALIGPLMQNQLRPDRRRRHLSMVLMPVDHGPPEDTADET